MRRMLFAFAAVLLSVIFTVGGLLLLDAWVRARYPLLNRNGYVGPILGSKQPGEYRIAVLGGSTVQGYGLPWSDAFPAQLGRALGSGVTVANLGFSNQGAYSFHLTLQQYAYLRPDLVVLYEGYNDLNVNTLDSRERSLIFRWTGYYPMLPIVAAEKAMVWRSGDLRAAYAGRKVVFTPNIAQRTGATVLDMVKEFDRLGKPTESAGARTTTPVAFYLQNVELAVAEARKLHATVLVVGQPRISERHEQQQQALHQMLRTKYPDVNYVNLALVVDTRDPTLCWDGMHLTAEGNGRIARALADAIESLRHR